MDRVIKRILEALAWIAGFITAHPILFEKAQETRAPGVTVIQTRETLTKSKPPTRSKGETL
jgi:hypothetical protein